MFQLLDALCPAKLRSRRLQDPETVSVIFDIKLLHVCNMLIAEYIFYCIAYFQLSLLETFFHMLNIRLFQADRSQRAPNHTLFSESSL